MINAEVTSESCLEFLSLCNTLSAIDNGISIGVRLFHLHGCSFEKRIFDEQNKGVTILFLSSFENC